MIRFDYKENGDGKFDVTVVSEDQDKDTHAMCGKLVLSAVEWYEIWTACKASDTPDQWDRKEKFFKFNNVGVIGEKDKEKEGEKQK